MREPIALEHRLVEYVPEELEQSVLYVSLKFRTVVHLCMCGCGERVVTPLHPTGWTFIYDGVSVSLYPSIGSWDLPCRSHYWIRDGAVRWACQWTDEEIQAGRQLDESDRRRYFLGDEELETSKRSPRGLFSSWFRPRSSSDDE